MVDVEVQITIVADDIFVNCLSSEQITVGIWAMRKWYERHV